MLVLSRQVGQSIVLGDQIKATVLEVNGNQIRLGIDAPRDIPIHREEIYERIQAEQIFSKNDDNRGNC